MWGVWRGQEEELWEWCPQGMSLSSWGQGPCSGREEGHILSQITFCSRIGFLSTPVSEREQDAPPLGRRVGALAPQLFLTSLLQERAVSGRSRKCGNSF